VGKTSVAAATGYAWRRNGYRTIIMSLTWPTAFPNIDLEKDLLDQTRKAHQGPRQSLVQELDIQQEIEKNWGEIHRYLSALFKTTGSTRSSLKNSPFCPHGGGEPSSLHQSLCTDKEFDVILLDCAPTGESFGYQRSHDLDWYIKKSSKWKDLPGVGLWQKNLQCTDPGDVYFDASSTFRTAQRVDQLMIDPDVTSVRLMPPEKSSSKRPAGLHVLLSLRNERRRDHMNRRAPAQNQGCLFPELARKQKQTWKSQEYFSPIPIFP